MTAFMKRNLKLFFRDKSGVFFSLLAVFIIIGLYTVFLGDVWLTDLKGLDQAQQLMNEWLIAGLLAVSSVTTTMGAFGVMVDDRSKKIYKDFYSSPVRRAGITGGYLASAFLIGVIMSALTLLVGQAYLLFRGGDWFSLMTWCKLLGMLLLSGVTNTALVGFVVSFFKSQNAFATASTIIGTLIGFLTGIYLPVGSLPDAVQLVVKLFPVSHAASLFRKIIMEQTIEDAFTGAPQAAVDGFQESMGIVYRINGVTVTMGMSIAILLGTAVLFYLLAVWNMSFKRKK